MDVGRRRSHAVHQPGIGVHPYVHLHPKAPLIPLLGVVHPRVPLPGPVLGGGRGLDDAGVPRWFPPATVAKRSLIVEEATTNQNLRAPQGRLPATCTRPAESAHHARRRNCIKRRFRLRHPILKIPICSSRQPLPGNNPGYSQHGIRNTLASIPQRPVSRCKRPSEVAAQLPPELPHMPDALPYPQSTEGVSVAVC